MQGMTPLRSHPRLVAIFGQEVRGVSFWGPRYLRKGGHGLPDARSPHPVFLMAQLLLVPSPAFLSLARLAAKYRCHLGLISPGHSGPIAPSSPPGLRLLNRYLVLPSSGVLTICYKMDERSARKKRSFSSVLPQPRQ